MTTTHLPPVLRSRSLLGHLSAVRADPVALFSRARASGDAVRVRVGHRVVWFVFEPALVEQVLVEDGRSWTKDTPGYRTLRHIIGDGLITSQGEVWRSHRRIANPAFHARTLEGFVGVVDRVARELAGRLAGVAGRRDLGPDLARAVLEMTGLTLFSQDISAEADQIGAHLTTALAHFDRLVQGGIPWLPTRSNRAFHAAVRGLDRVVDGLIAARHGQEPQPDLLGAWMAARDDDGGALSDRGLRDEVKTLLVAGHETTAAALSWVLLLLARHPGVQAAVRDEAERVVGDRTLVPADLGRLPVLDAVVRETLRLYPPVWNFSRCSAKTQPLGRYTVPAGTWVYTSAYAVHRHPAYWADPDAFRPERWSRGDAVPRGAWFPFGLGQRKCLGDRLALFQLAALVTHLLRRVELLPADDRSLQPEARLTLRPRGGVVLNVRSRGVCVVLGPRAA
ncbi:MAG: cytochrome P450 [Alphaproteobacteria bacterium]|nr:cytochrome P450 [Alphaproteobacteria bacterium]